MTEEQRPKWPSHKDHLNKTFLEELGYKLWNTKGIRFGAAHRLLTRNTWSVLSLGFLSAYLIIYGLFSVYQISGSTILDEKVIAFSSTTISILLLVFTQFESSQDYKLRSLEFHKCALEISALHDEVRLFKTIKEKSEEEKIEFCQSLSKKYQSILEAYPNHQDIDYHMFTAKHDEYYKLNWFQVAFINIRYYFKTILIYHLLIVVPVVIFVSLISNVR